MINVLELQERIAALLEQHGFIRFTEVEFRRATKECRDDIYADTVAHGGRLEDPFFSFIIIESVAVFTFFESTFSIYAFACDECELIGDTSPLALVDIDECKQLLSLKYGKAEPNLSVDRALAELWLST